MTGEKYWAIIIIGVESMETMIDHRLSLFVE